MANSGRNIRTSRRQAEDRKRRQRIRRISVFAKVSILIVFVFCIRNIYAHLEEMQMELKRLEMQQYGIAQTGADVQMSEKTDYVSSIGTWEVDKPAERTEAEVLQRLSELAQENSIIAGRIACSAGE